MDRFELGPSIGQGAMGTVFEAWDRLRQAKVAIKVLHAEGEANLERFRVEAQVLATLSHPRIVRYVAHGVAPSDAPYLAMEWLSGETLEARLARGKLTIADTLHLARQLAEGVAAAHRAGIVHRDLKPANLLLIEGQVAEVKITDFGIARRLFHDQQLTQTGQAIGTPVYMSPEQARGQKDVDGRSDVWSLGCILFECLTGSPPFLGANLMALLTKILLDEPPPLATLCTGLPDGFAKLVERMLAKDPSKRQDASELCTQLSHMALQVQASDLFATTDPLHAAARTTGFAAGWGPAREQRVMCALLIGAAPSQRPLQETLPADLHAVMVPPSVPPPPSVTVDRARPRRSFAPPAPVLEVLATYGAQVESILDGSMVVYWNDKLSPSEQTLRAARCALDLRAAVAAAPMVLCTGRAIVGGRLLIGSAIDRAAKLLEGARPDTIRLDHASAGMLDGRFDILGEHEVPELGAAKASQDAPRTLLGRVTPCLGRDRDLSTLHGMFDRCVEDERACPVLVTGAAGIGKSRIRHELLQRMQAGSYAYELHIGRGDSLRAGAPFGLLSAAIRAAAGILASDGVDVCRSKLTARVGRNVQQDVVRIASFLGEIAGVPLPESDDPVIRSARQDPRVMADQLLAAWLDWLESECAAGPVVFVIEDLHWGDLSSVQFLDASLRNLRDKQLMVLALARPEVLELFPQLWKERGVVTLQLTPLAKRASEKLVADMLGSRISDDTRKWIVDRADGNALYLEEIIRAVAAGKGIHEIPDTVVGMVQARLDSLGEDAKRVLCAASVFGETCRGLGVQALLLGERSRASVDEWLQFLTEREVLFAKGPRDQGEFAFRHALIRDSAYAFLTDDDRLGFHRAAGSFLEAMGENRALVLAEHFERGQVGDKARQWYHRAASQALEGDDLASVIACADKAIGFGAEGEELGELHWLKAEAHQWRGETNLLLQCCSEALSQLPRGSASWFRAMGGSVFAYARMSDKPNASAICCDLRREAAGTYLDIARALGLSCAALNATFVDIELTADLVCLMRDLLLRTPTREPSIVGAVRLSESNLAWGRDDRYGNLVLSTEAGSHFQHAGNLRWFCATRINIGSALNDLGAYARAEIELREAERIASRLGLQQVVTEARINLSLAVSMQSRHHEANHMLDLCEPPSNDLTNAYTLYYRSRVALNSGDLSKAEAASSAAAASSETYPALKAAAVAVGGLCLLRRHKGLEAYNSLREAYGMVRDQPTFDGRLFVYAVYSEACLASGFIDEEMNVIRDAYSALQTQAERIDEHDLRASFLQAVPEHAALVSRASILGLR